MLKYRDLLRTDNAEYRRLCPLIALGTPKEFRIVRIIGRVKMTLSNRWKFGEDLSNEDLHWPNPGDGLGVLA